MLANRKWCYRNSSPYCNRRQFPVSDNHPTRKLVTSAPRAYLWPVRFMHSFADAMFYLWTSDKAVSSTLSKLGSFFLFQSSHACRVNISEVKSFLHNQSVWDARKPISKTSIFCVIQDGGSHVGFLFVFLGESRRRSEKLKVPRLLTSNHKLLTAVSHQRWTHQTWIKHRGQF